MEKKTGPSRITIPEQKYMTCYGCIWLSHKMVKSGNDPIYKNTCTHKEFEKEFSVIRGTIGREIEDYNKRLETPDWCPILE